MIGRAAEDIHTDTGRAYQQRRQQHLVAMSGPTSARPAAKLFRNQFDVCIGIYDKRRGQMEGRESDKVLAFHPPSTPEAQQSSVVGLAQALTMFAGTFSKVTITAISIASSCNRTTR